jgi:hypothetical protein
MKTLWLLTILAAMSLVPASSGTAQAACTVQSVVGTYASTCTGFVAINPNDPTTIVPYASHGFFTNKIVGGELISTASLTQSVAGALSTVIGTAGPGEVTVSSDCTSTVTYHVSGGPLDGSQSHLLVSILDGGKEFQSFFNDAGTIVTCSARLMSRIVSQNEQ